MDNYKILYKGDDDMEVKLELLNQLGFQNIGMSDEGSKEWLFTYDNSDFYQAIKDENFAEIKELTLPQLRDLVVLKGKDAELVEQAKRFITPDHLDRFQAAQAHLEGKAVQFMLSNGAFFDITDDSTVGIFGPEGGYSFRLKPTTLKVNAELPKPNKGTQHNSLVYAVTYEFKTREERNAFADKLRGTNS